MILSACLAFFFAAPAFAQFSEARCKEDNCLTKGWEILAPDLRAEVTCRKGGCEKVGWRFINHVTGYRGHVECSGDGCFIDGFTEYDRRSGRPVAEVVCRERTTGEPDCLTEGWWTHLPQGTISTECIRGNCRELGWISRGFGRMEVVECKDEGCFVEGWVVR
jgi:hypothetical protein